MNLLTLENPVFQVYVIAASLVILKLIGHAYLTVYRMMRSNSGLLNPEDTRKTLLNPDPSPGQLAINDYVERTRRMHRNEGENALPFLAAGLLLVSASPPLAVASVLLLGYVAARLAHAYAYLTQRDHEVRATFFSIGSILTVAMTLYALVSALRS